jgi:oligopeptide/dipeptide ABC transporter ATP-binding protein
VKLGSSPHQAVRVNKSEPLLRVEKLRKTFGTTAKSPTGSSGKGVIAVDDVSFDVRRGETFGLVGESGCGKSTIARCIVRLTAPSGGRVVFDGLDLAQLAQADLRAVRQRMQLVFQDPFSSLDPRMTVRAIVEEPLLIAGSGTRVDRLRRVHEMLELVGLSETRADRKPHAFSGGERQRVALARAFIVRPELVILDEPVSALDVSIQAQVLNLLSSLQQELKLTYLFIVHDLAVAEHFCDRIGVLYLGSVMETGESYKLFREPLHPYTRALLSAVPIPDPVAERRRKRIILGGEVVPRHEGEKGCRFEPRCPVGKGRTVCATEEPLLLNQGGAHGVACHFAGEPEADTTNMVVNGPGVME